MDSKIDFSQAKQDHLAWKYRVRNFMDGKEEIEKSEMISHLHCRMGKWFYSEGKEEFGYLEPIKKFELKHIKLHKLAKDILELKAQNEIELAEELYDDLVITSDSIIELLTEAENILNKDIIDSEDVEIIQNLDKIVAWDKSKTLISKTDENGIIEYVNQIFIEVSGYSSSDLIGKSHNIVRHPDMPKVIYKLLWDDFSNGKTIPLIVKNLAKSGKYYWVVIDFKINKVFDNKIESFLGKQKGLNKDIIIKFIEPLYANLLAIENKRGINASEKYLKGFLEERNRTYTEYIQNLLMTGRDSVKSDGRKGFFNRLFRWSDE